MPQFRDLEDRTWNLSITVGTIRALRQEFQVNLLDLVDESTGVFTRLFGDVILFVDVLYFVCRRQADSRNVSDVDFGEALAGDVILAAQEAFLEALADFFPNRTRRDLLRQLFGKVRAVEDELLQAGMSELETIAPCGGTHSTGPASNWPAQRASTRSATRSANSTGSPAGGGPTPGTTPPA